MSSYQDVWRDGTLQVAGRRGCGARYDLIRPALEDRLGRGFTVADVGGWDGYFGIRLTEELEADATNIDRRRRELPIRHRVMHITTDTVSDVGRHDVILCLSVLHHMDDWADVYDGLKRQARLLIVELAHPDEAETAKVARADVNTAPSFDHVMQEADVVLGWTGGPNGVDRPTVLVRCAAWGQVADGTGKAGPLIAAGDFAALGYEPYPGTLNVNVGTEARDWMARQPGATVRSGRSRDLYVPATVNGVPCHASTSADRASLELLAPVNLRRTLNVVNGDVVEVRPR